MDVFAPYEQAEQAAHSEQQRAVSRAENVDAAMRAFERFRVLVAVRDGGRAEVAEEPEHAKEPGERAR